MLVNRFLDCQTYCSLIKINKNIYNLLLHTKIRNLSYGTENKSFDVESDYILKKHNKKHNIILLGEYGFTRVLIENNYKICCLLYDDIDYLDFSKWDNFSDKIDRHKNYQEIYIKKCIF